MIFFYVWIQFYYEKIFKCSTLSMVSGTKLDLVGGPK